MEPNNTVTLKEKLGNAINNIRFMLQSDKRILFAAIGIGVLVIVFITILVVSFFNPKTSETLVTTQTPGAVTKQSLKKRVASAPKLPATLSMVLSGTKKMYKVGDVITFSILGDSAGIQVRGYDAVFKFDQTKVSFVSEKNLYEAFTYEKRLRPDWVILTATEPISTTKKVVFSKTSLMGLTFKAVAPGIAYFPFSYIPDSFNDSNLIDTTSNDMLSNATGISVQIIE